MSDTENFSSLPSELMQSYRKTLNQTHHFLSTSKHLKVVKSVFKEHSLNKNSLTIIGPLGTGRKTVAKAIHLSSSEWWRPFVEVDLTNVNEKEADRYLYGRREDHFFSQDEIEQGLIESASGSTLCINNFCRYSRPIQEKLFELYSTREYYPFSGNKKQNIDCRFIFTLQKKPSELEKRGLLSSKMKEVLEENIIDIPPLSKRKDDIIPLAKKFISDCSKSLGIPAKLLSREAEKWLKRAPWVHNVLQLKRCVYFACISTDDNTLYPNNFALAHDGNIRDYQEKQLDEISIQALIEMKIESFLGRLKGFEASHLHDAIMDRVEEPLLTQVLNYTKGNQIKASQILGINRNTLRTKVSKYKIKVKK